MPGTVIMWSALESQLFTAGRPVPAMRASRACFPYSGPGMPLMMALILSARLVIFFLLECS